MKNFSIVCLLIILSSCSKELKCEAKNSQGDVMYEVSGEDLCENQISTENGEYCECSE